MAGEKKAALPSHTSSLRPIPDDARLAFLHDGTGYDLSLKLLAEHSGDTVTATFLRHLYDGCHRLSMQPPHFNGTRRFQSHVRLMVENKAPGPILFGDPEMRAAFAAVNGTAPATPASFSRRSLLAGGLAATATCAQTQALHGFYHAATAPVSTSTSTSTSTPAPTSIPISHGKEAAMHQAVATGAAIAAYRTDATTGAYKALHARLTRCLEEYAMQYGTPFPTASKAR